MKAIYFWKTLLCAASVLTTFTGCSDDGTDCNGSAPSISVNGKAEETLTVYLAGGATRPVNVVSSGEWTLAFSDENAKTWCHPNIVAGERGSFLHFDIDPSNAGRNVTVTLMTENRLNGFLTRARNTIQIVQSEGFDMATNVKPVRETIAALATPEGATIQEALTLTGIVVSDVQAGGTLGSKTKCYLTDNSTETGSGVILRFESAYGFEPGTVVSGSLQEARAVLTEQGLEIIPAADNDFVPVEGARQVKLLPTEVEVNNLLQYESQYVELVGVQPTKAFRGKTWYGGSSEPEALVKFEVESGGKFDVVVGKSAAWASKIIPAKKGFLRGIVVRDETGAIRIAPRNEEDVNGLAEEPFIYTVAPIADITEEDSYVVRDATVLATGLGGFLMEDTTGRIYVDQWNGTALQVPAIGSKVTVRGDVARVDGLFRYQPKGLQIEITGEGALPELTVQKFGGTEFTAFCSSPTVTYVKYTGQLSLMDGTYQVTVAETEVIATLVHPIVDDNLNALVGKSVDVIGWTIGAGNVGNAKSLMTLAMNVDKHASPDGQFITKPTAFTGINPLPQRLTFEANDAAGEVRFSFVPDDGRFIARKLSATEVEIAAVGYNISGTTVTGELLLQASDGSQLDRITLEQASMTLGSPYTWELQATDFVTNPNGSMTVGIPALGWNYTGVDVSACDAKYERGFSFRFENSELSTTTYEGAIGKIVIRSCQTANSRVTALLKVNGVSVAVLGSSAALKAGGFDDFEGLKCTLQTSASASKNDLDYITLTIDKTQAGRAGIWILDAPLAGDITFEMCLNGGKANQPLFFRSISIN